MSETCKLVSTGDVTLYLGKQAPGFAFFEGISREKVGSLGICMHVLRLPPGKRGFAHLHRNHETAIYLLSGEVDTWWGENLENFVTVSQGDFFYIPANVPHLPWNRTGVHAAAVVCRTDPSEQESVELLEDLDRRFTKTYGVTA